MWKKIIFGILIAALLVAGIRWYTYTEEIHTPVSNGINAIPSNAAIIFESKQTKNTWKKLSQTNIMWEELLGTQTFAKLNLQAHYIDSLLKLNSAVSQLLDNRSVFISAHISGTNTFDFLYVYSLPNLTYQSTVEEFIKTVNSNSEPTHRDYDGIEINTIHSPGKDSLSFAFSKGILMMSSKQNLVEDAIRQLKSGISFSSDKNFSKIINTAGKNVDANVYVNYKAIPGLLTNFIPSPLQNKVNGIADFADCSGWDINIKPNALMLSGFTQANDSSISYLNLFSKQKPQEIELPKVIPVKTALMIFSGVSNIKAFHRDYKNYLSSKQLSQNYEQYIDTINKKYRINIERSMLDWIDNEMALVITEPSSTDYTNNAYAVIRANNVETAINTLNGLTDSINKKEKEKEKEKTDTTIFKDHVISHLNLPELLPELLGWQFNTITKNYYTSVDDYVVFANSDNALRSFISDFENNKTLGNDKNYQAFQENISGEANLYIYSSIARSSNIYSSVLTEEMAKDIEKNTSIYHKFEAVSVQFSSTNNKLFYSTVYVKYNPAMNQDRTTLWESKLDTTVSSKPFLVINHNTKAKEILVQDDANKIYLISNTGKVIWTKQLNEKIMSDVVQVDVLKNNKLQLLFNTRSAIYMYDRNGNDMRGFPVKLKSAATCPIAVVDYEQNRDYRIFMACENKKILCYKTDGTEIPGFKFDKTSNLVYLPIHYFKANNKDHLCAVDEKGKVYIFDRQGETRIKIKELLPAGIRNFYIELGKDYSNTYLVTADTLGKIIKLNLNGDKESLRIQSFETSPYFEYRDINNDKIKEYIFLTRNELKVFSQDKSLLYKYEFKEKISQAPLYFVFPDGSGKIGVVSDITNELFLFNENGSLYSGFPVAGKTPFSIGDINNEGFTNLVTGSADNIIYVYQLE
jgi:predicted Fe-Mo cluster-binding NifX family protein